MRVGRTVWLHALVLALLCGRACASVSVSTWPSLLSAVSSATSVSPVSVTVTQQLSSNGTAAVVAAGASVTVSGACTPAPCTLDAATLSRHFVVGAGASLTLLAVALVNGDAPTGDGGSILAAAGVTLMLDGVTMDNNTVEVGYGGAVYLEGGTFTATRSVLSNNVAVLDASYGGAFSCAANCGAADKSCCTVTVSNSSFLNNAAGTGGGAINNAGPVLIQDNSTFVNNQAPKWGGGAVNNWGSVVVADSSLIDNGSSAGWGGAMDVNGNVTILRSLLSGNTSPVGVGGAIYMGAGGTKIAPNPAPTLLIVDSVVTASGAMSGGAVYADSTVYMQVSGSTFSENAVSADGGALYNTDYVTSISNCTFSTNSAPSGSGGAVYMGGDWSHTISGSTFEGNTAYVSAGAVFSAGGNLAVSDTVFDSNSVAGLFSRAGAVAVEALSDGSAYFTRVTFVGNQAYTPVLSPEFLVSSFSLGYAAADVQAALTLVPDATFGQGKGGAVFVANTLPGNPGAGLMTVNFTACTLSGNSAMFCGAVASPGSGPVALAFAGCELSGNTASSSGGALYVGNATAMTLTNSTVLFNTAAGDGGAIHVHGNATAAVTDSVLRGNAAGVRGRGGAAAVLDTSVLSLARATVEANRAFGGGAFYIANGAAGAAPALVAQATAVRSNFARAGGAWLLDAPTATPPSCALGANGCIVSNNTAWLGSIYATLPASVAVSVPASVRSSDTLAAVVTLKDGFGQAADSWDLLATASSPGGALSGAVDTTYGVGNATFPFLVLRGAVQSTHALTFTVAADSLGALNGASVTVSVRIQPCSLGADGVTPVPMELDVASQRCVCSPGAFSDGSGACTPCSLGSVAPEAGMAACLLCPVNQYSISTTLCAACPSTSTSSLGSSQLADCVCGYGFYADYSDDGSTFECTACPVGALCPGPTIPLALEGYWREPHDFTRFYECDEGRCQAQVPQNAEEENCEWGRTGITCGVCMDGFALQGELCLPCKADAAFSKWPQASQGGFASALAIVGVVVSAWFLLAPVMGDMMGGTVPSLLRHLSTIPRRWRTSNVNGGVHTGAAASDAAAVHVVMSAQMSGDSSVRGAEKPPQGEGAQKHASHHDSRVHRALHVAQHCLVPGRLALENMQIVSAFKRTVDVAWPRVFNQIMSRLRVFNFDFMHLPTASCLNPNLPYLKELMGVTLGITGIVAYIMLLWGLGSVIARARGLTLEERIRFHRTMLARLILFFIIIYAPLSETIVVVFGCVRVGDRYFLRKDMSQECYTAEHDRAYKAGIFWMFLYPAGIPAFFLAMLYYYRVPQRASRVKADANVRMLVDFAWQRRIPQPEVNVSALTYDGITAEHVNCLYDGVFSRRRTRRLRAGSAGGASHASPVELCGENGSASDLQDQAPGGDEASFDADGLNEASTSPSARGEALRAFADGTQSRSCPPVQDPGPAPGLLLRLLRRVSFRSERGELTREKKLERLLSWAKSRMRGSHLSWRETPRAQYEDAAQAVGVLFEEFYTDRWYWVLYEVLFKFAITCALSFVNPGTPAQIVCGIFITFLSMLYFQSALPYVDKWIRRTAYTLQIVLFLFFLLALLIKMNVVLLGAATPTLYGALAGILVISVFAVPVLFVVLSPTVRALITGSSLH